MLSTLLLGALLALAPAEARELAGVNVPETAQVGGKQLVLNGAGLREKYYIDIYVGSLYLPAKTTSDTKAITDDVHKRIVMDFIYKEVTVDQMKETFAEGLSKQPGASGEVKAAFDKLYGMMGTVKKGDQVVLDYVPGKGTTISFNGSVKGTLPGADVMRAIWTIYIGPNPPSKNLKKGMLKG